MLVGQALLALARGQLAEAEARIAGARSFVDERGTQTYTPLIALADGRISAAAGKSAYALEQFALAESLAQKMGMLPNAWQAQAAAAWVLDADGRSA